MAGPGDAVGSEDAFAGRAELPHRRLAAQVAAVDAEFELDIREAPVREVSLIAPKGYVLARINAAGMSDYVRKPVDIRGLLKKVSGWLEPTAA